MALPDEMAQSGGRPAWLGYIHVDDVDAMAKHIPEEGGQLHKGPITVARRHPFCGGLRSARCGFF